VFGKVDMEVFGCFSVEPVCCSVRANHMSIMLHCVDLGDVEVGSDLLLDELVLVCVKVVPCIFKLSEGMVGMGLEVSVVYEVKDSTSCPYNLWVCCVGDDTKEDLLHILILVSGPLRDKRYPLLEMVEAWVAGHRLETPVNLVFPTSESFGDPLDKVILENSLMKLVEDVRGEG